MMTVNATTINALDFKKNPKDERRRIANGKPSPNGPKLLLYHLE
jgi:hypothetical protein